MAEQKSQDKTFAVTTAAGKTVMANTATIKAMLLDGSLAPGDTVGPDSDEVAHDGATATNSRLDGTFAKQHFEIEVLFKPVAAHRRLGSQIGAGIGAIILPLGMLRPMLRDSASSWSMIAYYLLALLVQFTIVAVLHRSKALAWIWFILSFAIMLSIFGVIVFVPAALAIQATFGGLAGFCVGALLGTIVGFLRRASLDKLPA